MTPALIPLRYGPEATLIHHLSDRFGLDLLIDHFVGSGGVRGAYDLVLGSQLRLTRLLAPRLVGLLDEVKATLGFEEPIELFVSQDGSVNAGALHAIGPDETHVLSLTSALVERMTDDELRFVLGHEVGHLAWRHYRARLAVSAFGVDEEEDSKAPPLLVRRLESWDRLAELSADRAGFAVIGGRLEVAVSTFFKLQSGLGPEHLRFDMAAFLEQLQALQALSRRELLAAFSHPATPIRVRALQLFGEAQAEGRSVAEVDAAVEPLARLMDYVPSESMEVHARDLLLGGGLLIAGADGRVRESEWGAIVHLLLPLSSDPESEVARAPDEAAAQALVATSAAWLRDNAGPERFGVFRGLCEVAAADGRIRPQEVGVLRELAVALGIPERAAEEVRYDVLADQLQTQAMRGLPLPAGMGRWGTARR
jgi:uncharacterized tellurite resistance protein B-like protein